MHCDVKCGEGVAIIITMSMVLEARHFGPDILLLL